MNNFTLDDLYIGDIVDLNNINYYYKIINIDRLQDTIILKIINRTYDIKLEYAGKKINISMHSFNESFISFIKRSLLQKINILIE